MYKLTSLVLKHYKAIVTKIVKLCFKNKQILKKIKLYLYFVSFGKVNFRRKF